MMEPRKCPATCMGCTKQCGDYAMCMELTGTQERRVNIDPWYKPPAKEYIYTILWYYSDKSDFGVLDIAFRSEEAAQRIRLLLEEHSGTKQFVICQSEFQR